MPATPGRGNTRTTIYLEPVLHQALCLKAAQTRCSMSDLVNDAIRQALRADQDDLAAFETRIAEPEISYEALLKNFKARGKS